MSKIKNQYEVTIALPTDEWALELDGVEPTYLPDGRACLVLDVRTAGAMLGEDEKETAAKAARTAVHFFKEEYEEYADSYLEAIPTRLLRQKLVD